MFVSVSAVGIAKITDNGEERDNSQVRGAKPAEAAQQVSGEGELAGSHWRLVQYKRTFSKKAFQAKISL